MIPHPALDRTDRFNLVDLTPRVIAAVAQSSDEAFELFACRRVETSKKFHITPHERL
jgi:hypothetical protein